MSEVKAKWRVALFKANATAVAKELEVLGDEFSADDVLELAKNPELELNKCFTWDDAVASNKYRLYEAKQVIAQLVYVKSEEHTTEIPTRLYYKTTTNYVSTPKILEMPDEYEVLKARASAELKACRNKYKMLKELGDIVKEVFAL